MFTVLELISQRSIGNLLEAEYRMQQEVPFEDLFVVAWDDIPEDIQPVYESPFKHQMILCDDDLV